MNVFGCITIYNVIFQDNLKETFNLEKENYARGSGL